jgi:hypothetical protein
MLKRCLTVVLLVGCCMLSACAGHNAGTGQLVIDSQNAQEIALTPFFLAERNPNSDLASSLTLASAAGEPLAGLLPPNQNLIDSYVAWISQLQILSREAPLASPAGAVVEGCSGRLFPTISLAADRSFTGELRFDHFSRDCKLEYSGSVPYSGRLVAATGIMTTRFDVNAIQMQAGAAGYLITGELNLESNASHDLRQKLSAVIDIGLTDGEGINYRTRDLKLIWDRSLEYPSIQLDGELYHGRYGWVALQTDSPLLISPEQGLPYDGVLKFVGANGSWARIFFPRPGFPGAFRLDASTGLKTMGNL